MYLVLNMRDSRKLTICRKKRWLPFPRPWKKRPPNGMSPFVVNWRIQSWFTTQWAKTTPKRNTYFFQQAKNESFGHSELLFRIWGMMAGYVWVRFFALNKTCSVNWSGKMILHLQRWAISANRNTFLLNNNSKQPNLSSCNPHRKVFQTSPQINICSSYQKLRNTSQHGLRGHQAGNFPKT